MNLIIAVRVILGLNLLLICVNDTQTIALLGT